MYRQGLWHAAFEGRLVWQRQFPGTARQLPTAEYMGRILIILEGNRARGGASTPGFQSRFGKVCVDFPERTGEQASSAIVKAITEDAHAAVGRRMQRDC